MATGGIVARRLAGRASGNQSARSIDPWQWLQRSWADDDIRTIVECSPQFGQTETSSKRCRQ
jgi:hypothetical protein